MKQDKRKHDVTLQKDGAQSAILNSLFRQRGKRKSWSHSRIEGGPSSLIDTHLTDDLPFTYCRLRNYVVNIMYSQIKYANDFKLGLILTRGRLKVRIPRVLHKCLHEKYKIYRSTSSRITTSLKKNVKCRWTIL